MRGEMLEPDQVDLLFVVSPEWGTQTKTETKEKQKYEEGDGPKPLRNRLNQKFSGRDLCAGPMICVASAERSTRLSSE